MNVANTIIKHNVMSVYLTSFFYLLAEMAPYLLLGFLIAGLLHVFVPRSLYTHYLGKNNLRSVLLAALFGVPLPLCSCGVIPTAMSMRREGASRAATVSFLISTPQTGVDSIAATASLIGWPFALIRPLVAFVTALFGGSLVATMTSEEGSVGATEKGQEPTPQGAVARLWSALRYGFYTMIQDIGKWLVIGLLVAGAITVLLPDNFFTLWGDRPLVNMLLVLLISAPMYLCATGSVPIAAALMLKGLSPGAAFVLLMAGPATNMAAMLVIGKVLGRRTLGLYLLSILVGAIGFGLVIDYLLPAAWFTKIADEYHAACCHAGAMPWWKVGSAVVFSLLWVVAMVGRKRQKKVYQMENKMEQEFKISGMMCNHCKANVERTLAKIEGVETVRVDLGEGKAYVSGAVDPAKVVAAIEEMGYEYVAQ